jgi:hypothetical protein
MDHAIVQMGGQHSDEVSGGMAPIGLTGSECRDGFAIGHISADFGEPADAVHIDGDG